MIRRALVAAVILLALAAVWAAFDWYSAVPPEALAKAQFVGRQSCVACHQAEAVAFAGSDHDRAMEIADEKSVLGDFNNVEFSRFGDVTRFFRDGEKFMVNAEGPDGEHHDYEIKYTFGVDPLQQYMVEFPGGRLQVLRVSWDVHNKRWFFVAPDDAADEKIEPGDPLHWTGMAQNWNTMCADCHSTNFHKNFDLATNSYHSTYSEIDVSCEQCHGPGSLHVELAQRRSLFWDRNVGYGLTNTLKGASNIVQLETCAPCHSRRQMIQANFHAGDAYLDHFDPVLLYSGLYYPDGQIRDEVYVWGSFTQSKMFAKGVKCTDCHQPHAGDVKYPGNKLCAQCHQPGKYDGPMHHHHEAAAAGAPETLCVTCHMPTHTYMGIDVRHDHSIRVPRPDLTMEIGTPNACNQCHTKPEEDAAWAAKAIVRWFGPKRPDDSHYGPAIAAAEADEPDGLAMIRDVVTNKQRPDIVRATALELLDRYPTPDSMKLRREALEDESPLVRAAAIRSLTAESTAELIRDVAPRLEDKVREVRSAAANRLVASAAELSKTRFRGSLDAAIKEYRQAQELHLDRAAAHLNLARLDLDLGDIPAAIKELRLAMKIEPYLTGPRGELARLLEQSNGDKEEIAKLRREEADLLKRDTRLLAGDSQPHYRRGMLLYLLGEEDEALTELAEAVRLAPNDYDALVALALLLEKQKRWEEAFAVLKRMSDLRPQAEDWRGIYVRIRDTIAAEKAGDDDEKKQPQAEDKPAPAG